MFKKNKYILLICLIFSVLYSALSVIHHNHFLSGGFDLGIFDQALWQYAHFQFPYNTVKEKFILGDHLTLTLPLLAPLYWIWDDVRMLLIFQAVWISFSAFPIYRYLFHRKFSQFQSLILALLYLLFYGMQYIVYFDFHTVAIGVGLLAWILYFWEAEKWRWFTASVMLLLLTQENMGIGLLGLCIIWFFQKKRRKLVLLLAALSLVYTAIAFYTIKLLAQGDLQYVPQFPQTIGEWVTRFFDNQEKKDVWLFSFGWYSFIPIFSVGAVVAVILDLAQYFTTGDAFNHMWTPYFHHRAILSLFLLVGTADVLLFLKKKKINITYVLILMMAVALFQQWHYHFALNKLVKSEYVKSESWMRDNEDVIAQVPEDASIAAQQSLVPHLTHRNEVYVLYPRKKEFKQAVCPEKSCWWLEFAGKPEYILVDTHDTAWATMLLVDISEFRQAVENMERSKVITLINKKNEAKLYKINYPMLQKLQN